MIDENDPTFLIHQATLRLTMLEAIAVGLARHQEVAAAVVASADRDEAARSVAALLGLDELHAGAVLDLQWARLTQEEGRRIRESIAELRQNIEEWRRQADN